MNHGDIQVLVIFISAQVMGLRESMSLCSLLNNDGDDHIERRNSRFLQSPHCAAWGPE